MAWNMNRATLLGAALLILWILPSSARGQETSEFLPASPSLATVDLGAAEPQAGTIDASAFEALRLAPRPDGIDATSGGESCIREDLVMPAARVDPGYTQNACHYARGSTLIMHFFIDHQLGTWDEAERSVAGAKALEAKEFYLDQAPTAANLSFDNGTTGVYYYTYAYVDSAFTNIGWNSANAAMSAVGVTDADGDGYLADDYSLALQFWNGGYDNVILVFQVADLADPGPGTAFASSIMSACFVFTDNESHHWAHEWGHLFGGCDEYLQTAEDGSTTCHNGVACGVCPRPFYLDEPYVNGNCERFDCAQDVTCIMQHNTFDVCYYTNQQWSWEDEDGNGQLDWTKRYDSGVPRDIMEMWNGGSFVHNTTTASFVAPVTEPNWTVFGLRSPSTADYNMRLYMDNTLTYQPAWSGQSGTRIDFVVGDYSRSRTGLEHVQVERASGTTSNYTVVWQGTGQQLYADGVTRNTAWSSNDVVQIWDVELLAGETLTFDLEPSGGVDAGMALFWSYGDFFFAGRHQALWEKDSAGANGSEVYTYTVPSTGTYGLVVWKNNTAAGNTSMAVGPGPITLMEETPVYSAAPLRLYNYIGLRGNWAGVATRPNSGTEVSLTLYDDAMYTEEEVSSDEPGDELELVAVHYHSRDADGDHLRIPKLSGTGGYRTEFEQSSDRLTGYVSDTWTSSHVVKMWDVALEAGKTYVFRHYNPVLPVARLDAGIYLFDPANGDAQNKGDAAAFSDNHPASDGGEWFSHTASSSGDHGFAMVMNNEPEDEYHIWWGPRIGLGDGTSERSNNEVVFGASAVLSSDWVVWGARPNGDHQVAMNLMGDSGYSSSLESSTGVDGVNLIVSDRNHAPDLDTRYPRFRTLGGPGTSDYEYEAGSGEDLPFSHSVEELDLVWPAGDVAICFDRFLNGRHNDPQSIAIQLEVLTGNLDLGLAIFSSDNRDGESIQVIGDAELLVDAGGPGAPESAEYSTEVSDDVAVVIFNKNSEAGTYRIRTFDPDIVTSTETAPSLPQELAVGVDRNPLRQGTEVRYSLPEASSVDLSVFDVSGRLIESLATGNHTAGYHAVRWDGEGRDGTTVGAGVYFIRLVAGGGTRVTKVVQATSP